MRWFSLASLKALVSEITARENSNMQAVNDTFSEVYDNMETLDGQKMETTEKEIKARCAMQQSALWQSTAQVATLHALI